MLAREPTQPATAFSDLRAVAKCQRLWAKAAVCRRSAWARRTAAVGQKSGAAVSKVTTMPVFERESASQSG